MGILEINNVGIRFGGLQALGDVNLSIKENSVHAIIGPNGVGKTTLLKAIAGDYVFDHEKVQLFGEQDVDLEARFDRKNRAKRVAVLPQYSELQFPFSVEEVVALGRTPHSTSQEENEKIVRDVMSLMRIDALQHSRYTELSGGEKQRVQLARVFAQIWLDSAQEIMSDSEDEKIIPHRLLLLDEPSAALDFQFQQYFVDVLKYLASSGVAILIASHDINLSLKYTDMFIAMSDGAIYKQGSESEVITENVIKKLFDVDVSIVMHPNGGKMVAF